MRGCDLDTLLFFFHSHTSHMKKRQCGVGLLLHRNTHLVGGWLCGSSLHLWMSLSTLSNRPNMTWLLCSYSSSAPNAIWKLFGYYMCTWWILQLLLQIFQGPTHAFFSLSSLVPILSPIETLRQNRLDTHTLDLMLVCCLFPNRN